MRLLTILLFSVGAFAQVTTPLTVTPGTTATGEIRLREKRSNGENYVGLKAADSVTANKTWTLPPIDGTLGQALVTNGAGVLSWSSVAGSSFPVCASTTGTDAYTCTVAGFTAYSAGYCIVLYADTSNTGAATVDISGVGAQNIYRYGGSALANSDVVANTPIMICHDGTDFQLPSSASPGSGAFLDGGNSFGATATLGTNDNYDLAIERNNTTLITVGSGGIDMAPAGTANFYNKVRKLEITGISGETTFWDIQAAANMASSSNFKIRDNAGSRAILIDRAISGTATNNIGMFGNVIPRKRDAVDGDAVSDSNFPDLGSSSTRWANIYGGALNMSGNGTVGGTLDVTGNFSAAVINATGSPAYRVSGTTVINASREATFAGLTIPTGAVNNYVWTGDGSGVGSWQATQACATCFVNGGNTFGAAATLGTNDANILNFETDNATRWKITAAGMLQPGAADTYDIGDLSTARVRGVYAKSVDTAKSGGTGDYLQTRKLQLYDNTGSTTAASFWDLNVVMSGAGAFQESYFYMRDNGGNKVFQAERIRSGGAVDRTFWFTDLLPDTTGGQTLGSSSYRWGNTYVGILDASSSNTLVPNGTASLGASGNDWNRLWVGGVEVSSFVRPQVDGGAASGSASRQWSATYTQALTASGATYLQTTGIGEASPAKGLLSVYGHNGYAYTPFNQVVAARFRTGANSAILFGTTIPNPSGWTRGMYWTYLTEDWTLSRFKDDESSAPINDLYVAADGRVGIGTAAVTEELTVNGSIDVIGSGAIEIAGTTVIDASRNATVANLTITGACTGCGGLPVPDTDSVVRGNVDGTKLLRFEVDGFTTATTRVLTPQNASYTLAGTDLAQTFTAAQTFNSTVTVNAQSWVTSGNSFVLDRATRGTNQKIYWTVGSSTSADGSWSAGTTPSGAASRWVVDHKGTEHLVVDEGGSLYARNFTANDGAYNRIVLNNPGAGSNAGNAFAFRDSTGSLVGYLTYSGTLYATTLSTTAFSLSTSPASGYCLISDAFGTGTWQSCPGSLPVSDSTAVVQGSVTSSKKLRFEVDGFTAGATRVLTPQDSDYTIAGTNIAQTFSGANTFSVGQTFSSGLVVGGAITNNSASNIDIGSTGSKFRRLYAEGFSVYGSSYVTNGAGLYVQSGGTLAINSGATLTAPDGNNGVSATKTVRDAAGTGTCTLVFSGGILTGGTC